jgi:hypothetical protein
MKIVHGYIGKWHVDVEGLEEGAEIAVLHYSASYMPPLPPQPGDEYHQPISKGHRFDEVLARKLWEAERINATGLVVLSYDYVTRNGGGERVIKRYKPRGQRSPYAGLWEASKAAVLPAGREMRRFEGDLVFADYEMTFTLGERLDDLLRPCDL